MGIQDSKRAPTSEELYERLVTLAAPDGADRNFPAFTMEQLHERYPDVPEKGPFIVTLGGALSRCDAESRIKEGLGQPTPALGGERPGVLLRGSDRDRERLAGFIAAIEQGMFS